MFYKKNILVSGLEKKKFSFLSKKTKKRQECTYL